MLCLLCQNLEAYFDTSLKVYKNLAFLRDCISDLVDKNEKVG